MPQEPQIERLLKQADTFLEMGPSRHPMPFPAGRFLFPRNLEDQLVEQVLEKFPILGLGGIDMPEVEELDLDDYSERQMGGGVEGMRMALPRTLQGLEQADTLFPSITRKTEGLFVEPTRNREHHALFNAYDPVYDSLGDERWALEDLLRRAQERRGLRADAELEGGAGPGASIEQDQALLRQRLAAVRSEIKKSLGKPSSIAYRLKATYDPRADIDELPDEVVRGAARQKLEENWTKLQGASAQLYGNQRVMDTDFGGLAVQAVSDPAARDELKRIMDTAGIEGSARIGTLGKGALGIAGGLGLGALLRKHTDEDSLPGQLVRNIL